MKTINFLTSHFIPENTACTNRVHSFIDELKRNYKVNVICLTEKGVVQKEIIFIYSDNVKVYYVNQEDFNGKNFLKRAFNEIRYLVKLIKISKTLPSDMVIATTPYMFMIPLVGFGIKGCKILDIRDLVWEYLDEKSIIKKIIKQTITLIMKFGMKQFNHITVTNTCEFDLLSKKYGIINIDIIPNGIARDRYEKLTMIKPKTEEIFTVTYVGNIGLAQNLKVLIEAAMQLPDVHFLIIGDGIESDSLKNYVIRCNVINVEFTGKLPWNVIKGYYKRSSILYAQLDEKYISAMPSKLYEYASIGLPIIYGGSGQAKSFVEDLENSIAIEPNNANLIVKAIEQVKEKSKISSIKNRKLIKEKYLREDAAQDVVRIFDNLNNEK